MKYFAIVFFAFLLGVLCDAKTRERDIIALKLFKREVEDRDPYWKGVVQTWSGGGDNGEDDPCGNGWKSTWFGVECRFQEKLPEDWPRVVTNIHVTDSAVSGPIPMAISLLEDLIEIDFDGNKITGPLNPYLGCLSKMRELDLANNSLSGTIPTEWRWMTQLEEVELETNALLTGCIPRGMPPLKTVCREDTPQDRILNPGRPLCELVGTIVFDTAVGGFCPHTPAIEKRCPNVEFVEDFIRRGTPYEIYFRSQARSAIVTPKVREVPVEYESGRVTDLYAEVDPRTEKVFLRKPVRRQEVMVEDRSPPRVDPSRRVIRRRDPPIRVAPVAAPQTSDENRDIGLFDFLSSVYARQIERRVTPTEWTES